MNNIFYTGNCSGRGSFELSTMQRTLKAMSVKNFSDKEPTQIQEFGTRKEIKENEALINKGKRNIRIAVFISVVTLIITVSVWVPISK